MVYHSTLIRNVEIPSTLPPMDTLTNLTGSIILKEVIPDGDELRIEGDLLWRGFFEEGGGECLWEGAEYFTESLDGKDLRTASPSIINPAVTQLKGEALSESTFRLTFDIRWIDKEEPEEEIPLPLEATAKADQEVIEERHSCTGQCGRTPEEKGNQQKKAEAGEACPCHKEKSHPQAANREQERSEETTDFEEKLEALDQTWKESLKNFKEAEAAAAVIVEREVSPEPEDQEDREEEEVTIQCCPYSKFCLRYYRTQEGDELERIAERFSATVAKLRELNHLEGGISSGSLLRIP